MANDYATGLLSNPLFGLGIGLLSGGQPGGTMASGMQQGLLNMQAMQRQESAMKAQAQQQEIAAAQIDEINRINDIREKQLAGGMPSMIGQPAQPALQELGIDPMLNMGQPQPYVQPQGQTFPGEQPIPGLSTTGQPNQPVQTAQAARPATGLEATNPMAAGVLRNYWQQDPIGFNKSMAGGVMGQLFAKGQQDPTRIREMEALRKTGRYTEDEINKMVYPGPAGAITLNTQQELRSLPDQFNLDITKDLGKRISEQSMGAQTQRRRMGRGKEYLRSLVQSGDPTGAWLPMKAEAARWLGTDPEMVANAQSFMNLAGEEVMNTIQQTKGSVSEAEMDYFKEINPGTDKEPFTNFVLFEIADRAAYRQNDMAQYFGPYVAENGTGMGFEQWYMDNKDPYGEFNLKQMRQQYSQEIEGKTPQEAGASDRLRESGYVD